MLLLPPHTVIRDNVFQCLLDCSCDLDGRIVIMKGQHN